jgi:AcrR family transcriptional regulator
MAHTRDRIVTATAELFRVHGYTGTGLKDVVTAAGATFGSLYHWFPEGKEQLGEEVVRTSGRAYLELFEMIYDAAADPVSAVRDFFAGAAEVLEETGYVDACPIATVALEVASTNERLRVATADVFEMWIGAAAARFHTAGLPRRRARDLAITMIAVLEGAFALSRASRRTEPMRVAGAAAAGLLDSALREAAARPGRRAART